MVTHMDFYRTREIKCIPFEILFRSSDIHEPNKPRTFLACLFIDWASVVPIPLGRAYGNFLLISKP